MVRIPSCFYQYIQFLKERCLLKDVVARVVGCDIGIGMITFRFSKSAWSLLV